jgi:hypothetical protein
MNDGGLLRFQGAVEGTGTHTSPFTLTEQFRPPSGLLTHIDRYQGNKGRLMLYPNGMAVILQATLPNKGSQLPLQAFASLEGVTIGL